MIFFHPPSFLLYYFFFSGKYYGVRTGYTTETVATTTWQLKNWQLIQTYYFLYPPGIWKKKIYKKIAPHPLLSIFYYSIESLSIFNNLHIILFTLVLEIDRRGCIQESMNQKYCRTRWSEQIFYYFIK